MELWLDARGAIADDPTEWESFRESADAILVGEHDEGLVIPNNRRLVVKGDGKLVDGQGAVLGASMAVTDPKSQSRALSLVGSVDWIQVQAGRQAGRQEKPPFFVSTGRRIEFHLFARPTAACARWRFGSRRVGVVHSTCRPLYSFG